MTDTSQIAESTPGDPPPAPAPDPAPDPAPEPELPPEPEPKRAPPPKWALERISEESARAKREADARIEAERKLREAEEMLTRLQARQTGDDTKRQPISQPTVRQSDEETRIQEAARQLVFVQDTRDVLAHGMRDYGPQFNETLSILNSAGVTSNDAIVRDIIAVAGKDKAADLLTALARDPEWAYSIEKLDPTRRVAELTRMTIVANAASKEPATPAAPAAKSAVSKAPAPPPPVTPAASKSTDWRSDNASDEDFSRGWAEMMSKRVGMR